MGWFIMSLQRQSEKWNPFTIDQWIGWIIGSMVGIASAAVFLYMNFQTKDSFADYKIERQHFETELSRRLERMEDKLDQILRLR